MEKSLRVATLLTDYGAPIMMASDFVKFARLENSQYPTYLMDLIVLMVAVARHQLGHTSYMNNEFITSMCELFNSGNTEL